MAKKHISVGKSQWTIVGMCGGVEIYKINNNKKKKTYLKSFMQRIIQKRILKIVEMVAYLFSTLFFSVPVPMSCIITTPVLYPLCELWL